MVELNQSGNPEFIPGAPSASPFTLALTHTLLHAHTHTPSNPASRLAPILTLSCLFVYVYLFSIRENKNTLEKKRKKEENNNKIRIINHF